MSPPPRRRWFQFSLRGLLVTMLICAGVFGWVGYQVKRGVERRRAVEAILQAGGSVEYAEYSSPLGHSRWLRSQLGEAVLLDVHSVHLTATRFGDRDMVHLHPLTQLQGLWLDGTQVTDAGLIHLQSQPRLNFLSL